MKFGQMSIKKLSSKADYLQLDICGHSAESALQRFESYNSSIPIVLHGDWSKKGFSENNIKDRLKDYVEIVQELQKKTEVLGFTMHPTFRKKVPFNEFVSYCDQLEESTGVEVWIENRSNQRIFLSEPKEIISFSNQHLMTIDVAQLFISSGYSLSKLKETLFQINWDNIKELHLSNVKRTEKNTFVARKLNDGEMNLEEFQVLFSQVPYWTFEILGGVPTFEEQIEEVSRWK